MAERVGRDLVGYTDRAGSLTAMRASPETYFVQTHRQHDNATAMRLLGYGSAPA